MLAVALVFGIAAAFLSKVWLEGQVAPPQVAEKAPDMEMGTVVLAAKSLRYGNELSEAELREVKWPKDAIPEGAFSKVSDVVNGRDRRVVLSAIAAKEPVLEWKVTGPGQRASLSALIDEGMKAVTIRVNDVLGVAGFVLPGERVDVLLTRTKIKENGPSARQENAYTDVLLQSVRVLAIDQLADDRAEEPELAKAVTVEVTTQQAQKLVLSASVGQLALALRSAGSAKTDAARRIALPDLNNAAPESAAPATGASVVIGVTRAVERAEYSVPAAGQELGN